MISIKTSCGWCQQTLVTTLAAPIPSGWIVENVKSPDYANDGVIEIEETFCKQPCFQKYSEAAAGCHGDSADAYRTTFYARMNEARKKNG